MPRARQATKREQQKPVRNAAPVARKKPAAKAAPKPAVRSAKARSGPRAQPRDRKPGDKLNLVERVQLAQRIAAAKHAIPPETWDKIAKREGVPKRTCEYVYARYREQVVGLEDPTGQRILDESLLIYTETIALLGEATSKAETWIGRSAAAGKLLDAVKARIELLVVMGRMPRSIQASRDRIRVQTMLRKMAEVLERHGAEPDLIRDLLAIIDTEVEPVIEGRVAPALTP